MSVHPCLCALTMFPRPCDSLGSEWLRVCESVSPASGCVFGCESAGPYIPPSLPCFCRSLCVSLCLSLCAGARSLYVFHPPYCVWDPFLFMCLRVTFVCLCVPPSFRMILCARVSHSFFRVCVFVSPCIS